MLLPCEGAERLGRVAPASPKLGHHLPDGLGCKPARHLGPAPLFFRPICGSPMTRSDDLSRPEPGGRIDPLSDDLTRQRRSAGRLGPGSEGIRWQLWTHQRWRQHPLLRPAKASPRYEVSISKPAKQMQGVWADRIRPFFPLIRTEHFLTTHIYYPPKKEEVLLWLFPSQDPGAGPLWNDR